MRNQRRIGLAILLLAVVGVVVWLILPAPAREPEPVYQGIPLHQWLALYYSAGNEASRTQAGDAIRQIGTNAFPTLLKMIQEHDSPLKLKWIALLEKQHIFRPPQRAVWRNAQAVTGLVVLWPDASNAVPALVQIYRENHSPESQVDILAALGDFNFANFPAATPVLMDGLTNANAGLRAQAAVAIGQIQRQRDVFVPLLINALKDVDPAVRYSAAQSLGDYGPQAKSAVPAVLILLNDTNSFVCSAATNFLEKKVYVLDAIGDMGPAALPVATSILLDALTGPDVGLRASAISAIGRIHGQPDVFVPVLIKALKDARSGLRDLAAQSLGEYGPAAKFAGPALVLLLTDPDTLVRDDAADALKQIDPVAAAKAGIK